ncbi:hypothetical protein [Mycobacterium intermedium]|uniref:hypothetical protein n=1 Tax=Mycobacterium intermedium TaxID=28445 RepID=UPI0039ED7F0F
MTSTADEVDLFVSTTRAFLGREGATEHVREIHRRGLPYEPLGGAEPPNWAGPSLLFASQ